ncbi:hypothetical protein M2161_007030 [Streptomyces sp. SAI-133]|nr:hypothetical protein [Streptomyces sp. SAI-133]
MRRAGADTDPAQLAFEVVALMEAANAVSVLRGESAPYDRARRGIASRLRACRPERSWDGLRLRHGNPAARSFVYF